MQNGEPTMKDVLEHVGNLDKKVDDVLDAINTFASATEKRFMEVKSEMNDIRTGMATKEDLVQIRNEMATKEYIGELRSDMVDYIEKQNSKSRGDAVELVRKEDERLSVLIDIQHAKGHLDTDEVESLNELRPLFPIA